MSTFLFEIEKYGFELLMDLHKFEDNPNVFFESKPHTTDFFEIFLFRKASGYIEFNSNKIEIQKNSTLFISPYQKKLCFIKTEGIQGYHLVFQNNFLSDFFDDKMFVYRLQYFYNSKFPQHIILDDDDYFTIEFILNEIIEEIGNFKNDSPHIMRSLLYFYLSKMNRLFSKEYGISPDTVGNSDVFRFKESLESNIRKHHTVDAYCQILNITRHQLNKIVKECFGCTSKEIIHLRLLQEIKTELQYSKKTIMEIADDLDFSEPNNLTRFFTRLEGKNPSAFRTDYQIDR